LVAGLPRRPAVVVVFDDIRVLRRVDQRVVLIGGLLAVVAPAEPAQGSPEVHLGPLPGASLREPDRLTEGMRTAAPGSGRIRSGGSVTRIRPQRGGGGHVLSGVHAAHEGPHLAAAHLLHRSRELRVAGVLEEHPYLPQTQVLAISITFRSAGVRLFSIVATSVSGPA
jgi:hypothetical protein